MSKQAKLLMGRPLLLGTAAIAGEPGDGYESPEDVIPLQVPHHVMSPRTPTGFRTSGIIIGISQPSAGPATAIVGGFRLILWIADPTGYFWFRMTPVALQYRDASVTFDIDAAPLYLQVDAASVSVAGNILFNLMEV